MTPDDVRELAVPVLAHRLVLDPEAAFAGRTAEQVVAAVVDGIAPPELRGA